MESIGSTTASPAAPEVRTLLESGRTVSESGRHGGTMPASRAGLVLRGGRGAVDFVYGRTDGGRR